MNRSTNSTLLLLAAFLAAAPSARAQESPAGLITFQMRIVDTGGGGNGVIDDSRDAEFLFFDSESGGNLLLTDRHVAPPDGPGAVAISDSLATVLLGSGQIVPGPGPGPSASSLAEVFRDRAVVYLEPRVKNASGAFESLLPRTPLVATGGAINARYLSGRDEAFFRNAGNLDAGTLADARLSPNVALLDAAQVFSGAKTFSAPVTASGGVTGLPAPADASDAAPKSYVDAFGGWTDAGAAVRLTDPADKVGIGTSSPQAALDIFSGALLVPRNAADPTPSLNGMVHYHTGARRFRAFENGEWKNMTSGGGGGTGGGGGGSPAPQTGTYLVISNTEDLASERSVVVTAPLTFADGGANSTFTLGLGLVGLANGGTGATAAADARANLGAAASGANADISSLLGLSEARFPELSANGSQYVGFRAPDAVAANTLWTLPAADGAAGQVLKTDGAGGLSWTSVGGGTVTRIDTNSGLTGGPITSTGTISIAAGGVTTSHVANGTLVNEDFSPFAAIADTKLATIASAGKVADSALSANVTRLGAAVDLDTAEVAGVLPTAKGGTGASAFAAGSVLFSNGTAVAQDNANLFWHAANKWMGIGTSTPQSTLAVKSDREGDGLYVLNSASLGVNSGGTLLLAATTPPTAPDQRLGRVVFGALDGLAGVTSSIEAYSANEWGMIAKGSYLTFGTAPRTNFTAPVERMRIDPDGRVGIGSIAPQALLDIGGDGATVLLPRKSSAGDPSGADGMVYYNTASGKFRAFEGGAWKDLSVAAGAPSGASYLVRSLDPALTAERALAVSGPLTLTDGGPDSTLTLGLGVVGLANGGTGSTAFPAGRILFSNGSVLTHDAGLAWDNSLKRLVLSDGIVSTGISSPSGTSVTIDSANDVTVINDNNLRLAGPGGHLISNDFGNGFNLTLDSANGRVHTFDPFVFAGAAGDPAPAVNGEVYYNTASNRLRVFQGGAWSDIGGSGTVTQVNTGAGLTGGPITSTGTISIASGGVTNSMLANSAVTVSAGSGLSGGGTISLGGSATLSVASGGITSSHIAGATRFVSVQNSAAAEQFAVTNAAPALQLAGGGATSVSFDSVNRRVTISSTDTNSGGTVTQVNTGTGLAGGPINTSGTISLASTYQTGAAYDARFVNATGDTLTGALTLSGVNLDVTGGGQVRFTQSGSGNARFAESWGIRFSSTDASPGVTQHHLSTDSSLLVGHALTGANLGRGNLYVQNAAGIGTGASATPPNRLSVFTPNSVDGISLDGSVNPAMLLRASGTVRGYIAIPTTAGAYTPGAGLSDIVFRSEFGRLLFTDNAGATTAMTITTLTTGANTNAYVSLAGGGDPPASFRNVVGNAIAGQTTTQPAQGIFLGASEAASSGVIGVRDNSHFIKIDSGTNRMTFQEFGEFVWQNGSGTSPVVRMRLDASGNLTATGTKSAVVDTATHGRRTLYAVEAADVRFTDEGDAALSGGAVRIDLDPVFAETIEGDLRVHVTPKGPASLYVSEQGVDYFIVKSLDGTDVPFAWQVSAARKGFTNVRLAETPSSDPPPQGE